MPAKGQGRACGFSPAACAICRRRTNFMSRQVNRTWEGDSKVWRLFLNFCQVHAETPLPVKVAGLQTPQGYFEGYTLTATDN